MVVTDFEIVRRRQEAALRSIEDVFAREFWGLVLGRADAVSGRFWAAPREPAVIWEEKEGVKRRSEWELQVLINEAHNRRLDREITEMAFKGSKPGKGDGGDKGQSDLLQKYRDLVSTQSQVIHALAAALAATEEVDDDDEDESEDEDEEKESS